MSLRWPNSAKNASEIKEKAAPTEVENRSFHHCVNLVPKRLATAAGSSITTRSTDHNSVGKRMKHAQYTQKNTRV